MLDKSWASDSEFNITDNFTRYDNMMLSFADMVNGIKENPWSYDYELELYKTILKACGGINK